MALGPNRAPVGRWVPASKEPRPPPRRSSSNPASGAAARTCRNPRNAGLAARQWAGLVRALQGPRAEVTSVMGSGQRTAKLPLGEGRGEGNWNAVVAGPSPPALSPGRGEPSQPLPDPVIGGLVHRIEIVPAVGFHERQPAAEPSPVRLLGVGAVDHHARERSSCRPRPMPLGKK